LSRCLLFPPKNPQANHQELQELTTTELHFLGMSSLLKATHILEPTLNYDDHAYWYMLFYFCSYLPKSKGIIAKKFEDLEPKAIKAIVDGVCVSDSLTPFVYYIGPLIANTEEQAHVDGNKGDTSAKK